MKSKKKKPDADECCNRASVFFNLGDREYGIAYLRKALELDPRNSLAHFNLGVALEDLDRRQSIIHYLATIGSEPDNSEAFYALGRIYGMEGDLEKSVKYFKECIRLNPFDSRPYCGLGAAYSEKRNYKKSIASLEKAVELDPTDSVAYELLGDVKNETGDNKTALQNYLKSNELEYCRRVSDKINKLR